MQILNDTSDMDGDIYNKEEFSISDKYIYYCNADGLYRADIQAGTGFAMIFNASEDAYFTGEYHFYDMVYSDADTFYIFMTDDAEDDAENPTRIVMYKR